MKISFWSVFRWTQRSITQRRVITQGPIFAFGDLKMLNLFRPFFSLNPRLRKGGGYHPLTVSPRLHQNAKQRDPGHLSYLFYILCGHFDEKNIRGCPITWGYDTPMVSRQSSRVRGGWLPLENILSRHFEKYLHDMDLTLTEHVRHTISLL